MPALAQARESARRMKCLANLKGMGQGFALYMEKSKGILPIVRPLHDEQHAHLNDPSLLDVLAEFIEAPVPRKQDDGTYTSTDPYRCPSDRPGSDGLTAWQSTGTSYEYVAGGFMLISELALHITNPPLAFAVTKAYENQQDLHVLADWADVHTQRRTSSTNAKPRNALFFNDWRADWWPDTPEADISRFFEDIKRFAALPR